MQQNQTQKSFYELQTTETLNNKHILLQHVIIYWYQYLVLVQLIIVNRVFIMICRGGRENTTQKIKQKSNR